MMSDSVSGVSSVASLVGGKLSFSSNIFSRVPFRDKEKAGDVEGPRMLLIYILTIHDCKEIVL